jgi:molybdopterin/thiamine biosynthesis adenylyltransferase/rhodanese-related sulfurtransferase
MTLHSSSPFSGDELQRYARHLVLPGVGEAGQRKLRDARVLIVGAGGLGSPAALYLAAAGVGKLGIVDADLVELSNLQRQILYDTADVGTPKVDAARARVQQANPHVAVATYHVRLSSANALDILRDYDIVVDGTDNFATRYLISDACVLLGKPNVHGSVIRFDGQASIFSVGDAPCYRCLFPEPPAPGTVPDCAEGGVFGVLPGLIGIIQATETIKLILGTGETLAGRLLMVNGLRMQFQSIELARDPACPACGTHEITTLMDYDQLCGVRAVDAEEETVGPDEITPRMLQARLARGEKIALVDVREPYEWAIARLPDARLVPLNSLPYALPTLNASSEVVVYCHHGMRSAAAVAWLQDQGVTNVKNLVGGIDRWAVDIDPALRRY